jgi:cell division protein FtsB
MSRLADVHLPPAARRWASRGGLAVIVAIALGYLPGEILREDPRAAKLRGQLEELDATAHELAEHNAALARDVSALANDIAAIEARARSDFSMVYGDEILLRVVPSPARGTP